jgi:ribosomal protein L11 methyltransferase
VPEDTWLELTVEADLEAVEAVSDILTRVAPGGVAVEAPFAMVDEGLGAAPAGEAPATVRAYIPGRDPQAARAAVQATRTRLAHLQAFGLRTIGELEVRAVHESDWAAAWKQHFPVLRVGRRLVVRPTWRRHRARPDDVVLALDPGMAFGTGLHPTTRLCLAGVEGWADEGLVCNSKVLDVGCGSGILAITAAMLGATGVTAIDTDPIAVEATRANARRNRVSRRVRAWQGTLPARGAPFDLVMANLIASLLVNLADELAFSVRVGGRLLASGIFVDREGDVRQAFQLAGLGVIHRDAEGDWVVLDAERLAP